MPSTTYKITYQEAKQLMDAAVNSAANHNVPGAIAIVDAGGDLIILERLDNTMNAAPVIAMGKAATAVAFQRPTKDIENVILDGRIPMLVAKHDNYVPLKGAYPIWHKEQIIGGIAVAGTMDAEMDEVIAQEALKHKPW